MRSIFSISLLAVAMLSGLAAEAHAAEFEYQGWTGFRRHDDPAHGCIMGKHVDRDIYLLVYANDNEGFSIGVTSPSWDLNVGDELAGAASFDSAPPILMTGSVVEPDIILFSSGVEEDSIEVPVRNGRQIKFTSGQNWLQLPLSGSNRAIDMLWNCAEKSARAALQEDTPVPASPEPQTSDNALPLLPGFYVDSANECADASGPNTVFVEAAGLSWPPSGCLFENITKVDAHKYKVRQLCGRNADDIDREDAFYDTPNNTSFSLKTASGWELDAKLCDRSELPKPYRDPNFSYSPSYPKILKQYMTQLP